MAVELQTQEKTLIAILSGEIDHHCAQPMRAEIDAKIDDLQPSVLVLDFAGVTFMDSSGIGLIMGRHRTMEAIGGSVIVRDPPPHIRRVIRLSGMERIAQIQIQKPSCREGDFGIGGGENAVKFIFPGISENERTARAVVSAFLVQLDPTVEELADIRTAVSEAVTNAIVHGYRKSRGDVELHMKLLEDREVYLRIKDHG